MAIIFLKAVHISESSFRLLQRLEFLGGCHLSLATVTFPPFLGVLSLLHSDPFILYKAVEATLALMEVVV